MTLKTTYQLFPGAAGNSERNFYEGPGRMSSRFSNELEEWCNDLERLITEVLELKATGYLNDYDFSVQQLIATLNEAAAKGMPYALNKLGVLYETGILVTDEPDLKQAIAYYEQAAALDFPEAIYRAGCFYRYGLTGEINLEKALHYFEKGGQLNFPHCLTELAIVYEDGTVDKDYRKSFDYFHKAARLGHSFAIHMVGDYLENGRHNGSADFAAAFSWYLNGAEMGDPDCNYAVGRYYRLGIAVEETPDLALKYFRLSAEGGSPQAMVELGLCHEYEYGVPFNVQKAFDYMQQAATLGYYYGQYKLGYYYMHGLIQTDTQKGLHWFEKSSESGFPMAFLEIGDYYLYDYDEIDQAEKAFDNYQKALKEGYSHQGLGICYEFGIGVEENAATAFSYYEIAASRGYLKGVYHTAKCYLNGIGVKANDQRAFRYFQEAAQRDDVASKFHTGLMLLKGKGTSTAKDEGLRWLNMAADEGYAEALFELGNYYLMGDGVEEDEELAMSYFESAADQGHQKAMKLTGRKMPK